MSHTERKLSDFLNNKTKIDTFLRLTTVVFKWFFPNQTIRSAMTSGRNLFTRTRVNSKSTEKNEVFRI